jgi:hypothetical protein
MKDIIDERELSLEVELITDSWFAKRRLILRAKKRYGFSVITMARKDLATYKLPPLRRKGTKGRCKVKGKRIKPELEDLKKKKILNIYGREIKVSYKVAITKVRFLKWEIVKAVWVRFDESQSMRLIISTDITLTGEEIIKRYGTRWDIEAIFNELKNSFKFKKIMMHSIKSYYQFLYFKIWCFIIIKLSSFDFKETIINYVKESLPWRVHHKRGVIITAGNTQLALKSIFATLHIGMFFPKVDKKNRQNHENNVLWDVGVDGGYEKTG